MARSNTWLWPRQRRKRHRLQRARNLPTPRSQHVRAERWRIERLDSDGTAAYSSEANRLPNNNIDWLLDSGCSHHIINNENCFENYCSKLKELVNIYLGDNRSVKATKIGNIVNYFNAFGNLRPCDTQQRSWWDQSIKQVETHFIH